MARLLAVLLGGPVAAVSAPHALQSALMLLQPTLENRFKRPDLAVGRPVSGLIVVGGQFERFHEVARLAHKHPQARLIVSGPEDREIAILQRSGLPPERMLVDRAPRNTFENARHSRRLAAPQSDERWVLVTSALHMPRAVGAFHAAGFRVEPWPVDDAGTNARYIAPRILHEIGGLIGYRLTGRSPSFFPGETHSARQRQPLISSQLLD